MISFSFIEHRLRLAAARQLRHAAATRFRKAYGLEAAQVLLGHRTADVTQIYAERDRGKAEAIMERIDRTLREMQAEVRAIYRFPPLPTDNQNAIEERPADRATPK